VADQDVQEAQRGGFMSELRDAISVRAFAFVLAGLFIQLAFILSYVGAFHSPKPHDISVAVVAPSQVSAQVVAQLNALDGKPVEATAVVDEATARQQILHRETDAAFVLNATGTTDTLLVASAGGPSLSATAAQIAQTLEASQHRSVTVTDIRSPNSADGRGMTSFYLVIGWAIGGYLVASILGTAGGARPANTHRTVIRLGALLIYSVVSGIAGALIIGSLFHALPGHFLALSAIGTLIVFASAATAVALQVLFGIIGVGLSILLFVVLGNPSSGGVYPASLLPAFWRAIGQYLPPGAGTTLVRNTVYFTGHGTASAKWTLLGYALAGTLISLLFVAWHDRRKA
jgi:hypothetical protein